MLASDVALNHWWVARRSRAFGIMNTINGASSAWPALNVLLARKLGWRRACHGGPDQTRKLRAETSQPN